jgi:lysophospholipase L1-like esterase
MRFPMTRAAVAVSLGLALTLPPLASAAAADSTWPVTGQRLTTVRVVETLGDSVPYGTRCGCAPFPSLTATRLAALTGPKVISYNDSYPGYGVDHVLAQLTSNSGVRARVRSAHVVVVEIGANDISSSISCGTSAACYTGRLAHVRASLTRIVSTIRSLAAGRPIGIVLLGYWNVWLDGKYAAARGAAYVRASVTGTHVTNALIRSVAQATGSAYADLWLAFRGTTSRDDTALLAPDGDHPNAAGHAVIASAVLRVLLSAFARIPYPAVSLAHLIAGAHNTDVTTYQEAAREFLTRVGRLGTLDVVGITGAYGGETRSMTRAAYGYEARVTGDLSWLEGDLTVPGPGLLSVLGLRRR